MSHLSKSRRPLRIVVLADHGSIDPSDPHCYRPHGGIADDLWQVSSAIRRLGHQTLIMPFKTPVSAFMERLEAFKPDVVFNSTEAIEGDRCAYAHIAALLHLMRIPYTGSAPLALAITMDKALTKRILRQHGVPVPDFFVAPRGKYIVPADIQFPYFVKPLHGGGKEGITRSALVRTPQALKRRVAEIHDQWKQPAICEKYIDGREMTLGILGNHRLRTFPVRELVFKDQRIGAPRFLTGRVLEDRAYRKFWNIEMRDAQLSAAQRREVVAIAKTTYKAVGLQGYGRMDMRFGTDEKFYVIEVNANPALRRPSASLIAPWGGISYEDLISNVLTLALARR